MVWWGGTGRCGKGRGGGLFLVLSEKVNGHQVRNAVVLRARNFASRDHPFFFLSLSLFIIIFIISRICFLIPSPPLLPLIVSFI